MPGSYGIQAESEGYDVHRIDEIEVISSEGVWRGVRMSQHPTGGWIEGNVVNPNGEPMAGVPVYTVYGRSPGSDETNREGYYKLDNLEPGSYGIEANIPGCGVQRIDEIDVRSGEGVRRDFQVSGGFIEGKVFMRDGGPMGGVHVYTKYGPSSRSDDTNDDGYYKLDNLIPGSYGIEADILDCGVQRIDEIDVKCGEGVWRDIHAPSIITPAPLPIEEPDLVITDVLSKSEWDGETWKRIVYYEIKNQGKGPAGASMTYMSWYSNGKLISTDDVPSLAVGETRTESFAPYPFSDTGFDINVCADGDHKIDEEDATNNCKRYKMIG